MERIQLLIENIKNSNLSEEDKSLLIEKLQRDVPDINGFLQTFITICKVSNQVLKLFDIDVWSD